MPRSLLLAAVGWGRPPVRWKVDSSPADIIIDPLLRPAIDKISPFRR